MALLEGVTLRPEQATDEAFLLELFRSHALAELAPMPMDATTKDLLARMQFAGQSATYRANFPNARFDLIEQSGVPIGRLVIDDGGESACIVDFALLPDYRGGGLGTAILARTLERFVSSQRNVRCKVLMNNAVSMRMCLKLGFVHIGGDPPFHQMEWTPAGPK
jgi:RimJ/RimL family protein N-acetyltransferase